MIRTRTIPPALRRALEARDRGCRFPGCGGRFTDAHHVIPWAAGGDTSLGNCVLLCKYHHRLVHEGGLTVDWWGEGRPVFYDPRGSVHCEVRWEAPDLGEELAKPSERGGRRLETLIPENQKLGVDPNPWALGARWKREEDLPDRVYFGAVEAMSSGPSALQQVLPAKSLTPGEIPIRGAEDQAAFHGESRQVDIGNRSHPIPEFPARKPSPQPGVGDPLRRLKEAEESPPTGRVGFGAGRPPGKPTRPASS